MTIPNSTEPRRHPITLLVIYNESVALLLELERDLLRQRYKRDLEEEVRIDAALLFQRGHATIALAATVEDAVDFYSRWKKEDPTAIFMDPGTWTDRDFKFITALGMEGNANPDVVYLLRSGVSSDIVREEREISKLLKRGRLPHGPRFEPLDPEQLVIRIRTLVNGGPSASPQPPQGPTQEPGGR